MKKIILSLMTVMACLSINAQEIKLQVSTDSGESWSTVDTYKNTDTEKYKVVTFATKGTAKATEKHKNTSGTYEIYEVDVDVDWVQLWDGGPKFATRNLYATSVTNSGYRYSIKEAAAISDAEYNWGSNWRVPTKEELDVLLNTDKVTYIYNSGGYTFKGVEEGYTDNTIFIPAAPSGYYATYLSSTDSTHKLRIDPSYGASEWPPAWIDKDGDGWISTYGYIRPVLAE